MKQGICKDLQGMIKWEEIFQRGIFYCFWIVAAVTSAHITESIFLSLAVQFEWEVLNKLDSFQNTVFWWNTMFHLEMDGCGCTAAWSTRWHWTVHLKMVCMGIFMFVDLTTIWITIITDNNNNYRRLSPDCRGKNTKTCCLWFWLCVCLLRFDKRKRGNGLH